MEGTRTPLSYKVLAALIAAGIMIAIIWASDRVTPQGERVLYTVNCVQGAWNGKRCTGKLTAGDRYVFRSSVRRREVIVWVRDSQRPSLTYTGCTVTNRDNWTCSVRTTDDRSALLQMLRGKPSCNADPASAELHAMVKWKWWMVWLGVPLSPEAPKTVPASIGSCGRMVTANAR